jgi:hypothetical protein
MAEDRAVIERKKTGYITQQFKDMVTETLSSALGIKLDERAAWSIWRLLVL